MSSVLESLQRNKTGILLMLFASFTTALGQMFWKMSNGELNRYLLLGFFFYFLGAVFMIVSFRFGSLSVLHPFMSVGYVFSIVLGIVFLSEMVTLKIIMGIFLIMVGVMLIGVVTISWALLLIIMTIAGAFGGFFLKKPQILVSKSVSILSCFLGIGGFFYLFSSILNIIVLKHMPYTVVFPLTSITYIWTLLISYFFLKESITGKKIAGILLICIGAVFLVI